MTVVPAFLRFLDGSFIKKKSGEIHKRSCEFFEADNLLTLVAVFFYYEKSFDNDFRITLDFLSVFLLYLQAFFVISIKIFCAV